MRLTKRILPIFTAVVLLSAGQLSACPNGFSSKDVFGVKVCGGEGVSAADLSHAAKVLKKNLDFNENGKADNSKVVKKLVQMGAAFVVFKRESQLDDYADAMNTENFTSIGAREMVKRGRDFDPTIEETLHLVTQFGYAETYPKVFGEHKGSQIAKLHDEAKKKRYFVYRDPSCDYACMITEFTYWAVTSMRGQQKGRDDDIGDEWKLASAARIKSKMPELYTLLTDKDYGF